MYTFSPFLLVRIHASIHQHARCITEDHGIHSQPEIGTALFMGGKLKDSLKLATYFFLLKWSHKDTKSIGNAHQLPSQLNKWAPWHSAVNIHVYNAFKTTFKGVRDHQNSLLKSDLIRLGLNWKWAQMQSLYALFLCSNTILQWE